MALGNCFPEMYFGIVSGQKEEGWMVVRRYDGFGDCLCNIVLGIIGVVAPFEIKDMSPFFIRQNFYDYCVQFSF